MTNDAERVSDIVAWRWRFKTAYSGEYIDWCVSGERCPEDQPCRGFDGFEEQALYTADIIEAQSKALAEARDGFECEDCIGTKATHGCYCDAMGAERAGGPKKGSIRDDESTASAMERAQHLRERGWLLEAAAERLEQEAHDRAAQRGEHTGTDGI